MDGHRRDGLLAAQKLVLAPFQRTRLVGNNWNQSRNVGIVCLSCFSLGNRPHDLVPIGGLDVENIQFALSDGVVGQSVSIAARPFRELEERAITVRGKSIGHTVSVEPIEILVIHSFAKALRRCILLRTSE